MFTRVPGPNDIMNNTVGDTAVEGRIIPVGRNGEAIVFEIPMGFFKLVAIANIPEEGAEKAPVYLKLKVGDFAYQRAQQGQERRRRLRESQGMTGTNGNSYANGNGSDDTDETESDSD